MSGWTMSIIAHRATDIPRAYAPAARRSRGYVPRREGAARGRAPITATAITAMRRPFRSGGGRPASSNSVHAPARPTLAPIMTSAGECMCRASREIPITAAAMAATRSAAWRQRNSSTQGPLPPRSRPQRARSACGHPGVPKLAEQARNSTFSASIAANVAKTAAAQAAAPRRHPCVSSAIPIASASGSMTA